MSADVSTIFLVKVSTGEAVEAELRDAIEEAQLVDWQMQWRPALLSFLQELRRQRVPISQWPENWHWDWKEKAAKVEGLLGFRGFCVVQDGVTQGLMRVDLTKSARLMSQRGKPLVYVDYLEPAPWNRPEFGKPARLRGVGTALMIAATALSMEEDFASHQSRALFISLRVSSRCPRKG